MNRLTFLKAALCAFALCAFSITGWAQTTPGAIKAVRVSGTVQKVSADGSTTAIAEGQSLIESDTVVTDATASVVLVFMNGSTVRLAGDSRLAIEEFKMDPLASDIRVANLQAEPSVSRTRLNLAHGELVGNVKTLNRAGGSSFNVRTPVGAAGIRGTTFRILLRLDPVTQAFAFSLSTQEGVVAFSGFVPATSTTPATEVEVAAQQEVTATASVNPTTNDVTNIQVSTTQPISQEAARIIQTAVNDAIQQAQQSATFTPTEQRDAARNPPTPPVPETPPGSRTGTPGAPTTPPTVFDPSTRSTSG